MSVVPIAVGVVKSFVTIQFITYKVAGLMDNENAPPDILRLTLRPVNAKFESAQMPFYMLAQ